MALSAGLLAAAGCYGELTYEDGEGAPPYGRYFDLVQAEQLFQKATGHESWPGFQSGAAAPSGAHGASPTIHLNPADTADPALLEPGTIIVCTSADPAAGDTGLFLMARLANFDPEHADWFWARYDSAGEVAIDARGVPLAGAIDVEGSDGCIGCHASAPGNDFVFTNGGGS